MDILARFPFSQINHAVDTDGHFVLSLVAPAIDGLAQRPKLAILPVIDLSGSMRGSKLEYAKRSLRKLVDHLAIGDVSGLFGFENTFHPLVAPEAVTPEFKEKLRAAIDKLHIMGGTNYADAIEKSVKAMQGLDLPLSFTQRIILFTDGQPTVGITDKPTILKLAQQTIGESRVTISYFGYGAVGGGEYNGCDQDFLLECSKQSSGNYAYVPDPDAALGAFGKELGGLLSAYASDLRIFVEPVHGHQIASVVSDVEAEEEDATGQVEIKLADLLSEETRHIVFATKLLKQNQAFPRPATVFNVKVIFQLLTVDGKKEGKDIDVKARVQFVKPEDAQKVATKEVDEIVGLAQMVRAQIQAEEKAKGGNYAAAAQVMESMSFNLAGRGHERLGHISRKLSHSVGSQRDFSANAGYLSSMKSGGTRAYGTSSMDAEAASDLASTGTVSSSNVMMDNMVRSFTTPLGGHESVAHPVVSPVAVAFGLSAPPWGVSGGPAIPSAVAIPAGPLWSVPEQSSPEKPAEVKPAPKRRISQGKSKTRW